MYSIGKYSGVAGIECMKKRHYVVLMVPNERPKHHLPLQNWTPFKLTYEPVYIRHKYRPINIYHKMIYIVCKIYYLMTVDFPILPSNYSIVMYIWCFYHRVDVLSNSLETASNIGYIHVHRI